MSNRKGTHRFDRDKKKSLAVSVFQNASPVRQENLNVKVLGLGLEEFQTWSLAVTHCSFSGGNSGL